MQSVIEAKLTVIKLEMLDTPLLLPDVLGVASSDRVCGAMWRDM